MQTDMTNGKPMKMILSFTIPVFIGMVFQQFYNMVDAIIVGQFVGTKALAAVGSTGTITFLILGFVQGVTTGFTVLTSQKFGAGRMEEMRQTVGSAAVLSTITAVLITAVSMLGMHSLLTFMNTPADIFDDAYAYVMIICGGIAAQVLYNLLASILRALGNSRTPLYFLIISALLNIVLDLVFIIVFHMGAAGAAWATVISQGISGVLCLLYIMKSVPELHLRRGDFSFRKGIAKNQIKVGIPMGLQFSITAIGSMMVQVSLNLLGSYQVAAFTAGNKIEGLFSQAFMALGTALSTFNAQNIGARRLDRVKSGFRAADVIGITYAVIIGLILTLVGKNFSYLFISENIETVVPMVDTYLKCAGYCMIPLYVVCVYRSGFQGMGYGVLPMMSGVAELLGRAVVAVTAAREKSYFLACMANPAAWLVATALLISLYFFVMKDMKKRLCL